MLEKMNTRRWIAVGVAVLILGISAISSGISDKINSEARMKKMEASFMNTVNGMNEEVVEEGDAQNRIAVITVEGAIMNTPQASFLTKGYDHQATLNALDEVLKDDTIKGVLLRSIPPAAASTKAPSCTSGSKPLSMGKSPFTWPWATRRPAAAITSPRRRRKFTPPPPPSPAPSASLWVAPISRASWIN